MKIPARNSTAPVKSPGSSVLGSNISCLVFLIMTIFPIQHPALRRITVHTGNQSSQHGAVGWCWSRCLPEKWGVKANLHGQQRASRFVTACSLQPTGSFTVQCSAMVILISDHRSCDRKEKCCTGVKLAKSYYYMISDLFFSTHRPFCCKINDLLSNIKFIISIPGVIS